MKIIAELEASQDISTTTFTLEEIGMTKEGWDKLTDEQKHDVVQETIYELPEQPYWVLSTFIDLQD